MRVENLKTLWIGKDAYFFLERESSKQRGCTPLTPEQEAKQWDRIKTSPHYKNGMYRITKDTFGGGDGTYNGKWWSWSIDTIKTMLNDNEYKYRNGKAVETVSI